MKIQEQIEKKLREGLKIELLEILNESPQHKGPEGAESHFRVLVVSSDFQGLSHDPASSESI